MAIDLSDSRSPIKRAQAQTALSWVSQHRRLTLWIVALALSLLAGWLLLASARNQWTIGIVLVSVWFTTIVINTLFIDALLRKEK